MQCYAQLLLLHKWLGGARLLLCYYARQSAQCLFPWNSNEGITTYTYTLQKLTRQLEIMKENSRFFQYVIIKDYYKSWKHIAKSLLQAYNHEYHSCSNLIKNILKLCRPKNILFYVPHSSRCSTAVLAWWQLKGVAVVSPPHTKEIHIYRQSNHITNGNTLICWILNQIKMATI